MGTSDWFLFVLVTSYRAYCKTLYFRCILIWRFWSAEISLHFNLAFSQGVPSKVTFHATSHVNRIVYYRLTRTRLLVKQVCILLHCICMYVEIEACLALDD